MAIGKKISDIFEWPCLTLEVDKEKCIDCKLCDKRCQMSLGVNDMVEKGAIENS